MRWLRNEVMSSKAGRGGSRGSPARGAAPGTAAPALRYRYRLAGAPALVQRQRQRERAPGGGQEPLLPDRADEPRVRVLAVEQVRDAERGAQPREPDGGRELAGGEIRERVLVGLVEPLPAGVARACLDRSARHGSEAERPVGRALRHG